MKNQLKNKLPAAQKTSGPSPIAVSISNGVVTDEITVDDMSNDEVLRDVLKGWPLCIEPPIVHVRKLFSIDDQTVRLRLVLFVAALHKTFRKQIGKDKDAHSDLLEAILAVGPTLRKRRYRSRTREAAVAAAVLLHWNHLQSKLQQIRAAFQDAGFESNTHKTLGQLADIMLMKLRKLDAEFFDRTVQGPINNPYMYVSRPSSD